MENSALFTIFKKIISGKVYRGKEVRKFEEEFARYIGVKHAVCFASGRYAMYMICKFFNCQGKKVLLPSYTCIAAIDSARWAGVEPFFLDISLDNYNPIFSSKLKKMNHVGAITLSYLYGLVGNIEPFLKLAKEKNIPVFEDAAICMGGSYKGKKVGSIGDAAIFSLQSSKVMTSWRGGVITTNNDKLYTFLCEERKRQPFPPLLKLIFNASSTYIRKLFSSSNIYGFTMYPLKKILSSNLLSGFLGKIMEQNPLEAVDGESPEKIPLTEMYQFTNLQAALALSSLKKVNLLLHKRRKAINFIISNFKDEEKVKFPKDSLKTIHTYGRFPLIIEGFNKFYLEKELLKHGVETSLYYPYICPNTLHMKKYNINSNNYPNALNASKNTILLPAHSFLNKKDSIHIIKAIKKIIK